jgi:peptidoglycan/xylan/chitin deacetylase (PgdA/CDA1 family)
MVYVILSGIGVFAVGMNYFCEAVCRGEAGKKRIALTFDDGPDSRVTPDLLDLLKKYKVHASFFCVGQRARENPGLIQRIVNEGHTLGNHSYSHHWWTNFLTTAPLVREMNRTQRVLKELSGITPRYYRSPMGLSNPHLPPALRATGLKLVAWNVRPYDRGASTATIVSRIVGNRNGEAPASDGSVVLLHDGGVSGEALIPAVRQVIERFQEMGYSLVSLDELLQN